MATKTIVELINSVSRIKVTYAEVAAKDEFIDKDGTRCTSTGDIVVLTDRLGKRFEADKANLTDPDPAGKTAEELAAIVKGYLDETTDIIIDGDASNLARETGGQLAIIAAALENPNVGASSVVAASTSSVLLLPANSTRADFIIRNDSPQRCVLGFGEPATLNKAMSIPPSGIWFGDFSGVVNGIWPVANGSASTQDNSRS